MSKTEDGDEIDVDKDSGEDGEWDVVDSASTIPLEDETVLSRRSRTTTMSRYQNINYSDRTRWSTDGGLESLGIEDISKRMRHGSDTTQGFLDFLKKRCKAEETLSESLRKAVGSGKEKSGWFGFGGQSSSASSSENKPHIGPESWEGLNGALNIFAHQIDREAEDRSAFAKCVKEEISDAISRKHQQHNRAHASLLDRYQEFVRRHQQAQSKVTKSKSVWKSKSKEETYERERYDQMLKQMEQFHQDLEKRMSEGLDDQAQEKAAHEQVYLSRELSNQKKRWMKSCESVDSIVKEIGELQSFAEAARIQMNNVVREVGQGVIRTEIERVYLLRIALESMAERERSYHEKQIERIDRMKELLRTVDADTDLRLAVHNQTIEARIQKACQNAKQSRSRLSKNASSKSPRRSHKGPHLPSRSASPIQNKNSKARKKRHSNMSKDEMEMETMIHDFVMSISAEDDDDETRSSSSSTELSKKKNEEEKIIKLFKRKTAREMYIRELNRQRSSNKSMRREGFKALSRTMRGFLDACVKHSDVKAATMLMIMSQTFFKAQQHVKKSTVSKGSDDDEENEEGTEEDDDDTEKEFVQWTISGHPIWKDLLFWEEAFLHIVREEVEKNHTSFVSRGSDRSKLREEANYHYKQIVFGQLGSIAVNMISFGMSMDMTKAFILKMCVANGLSEEEMQALVFIASKQEAVRVRRQSSAGSLSALAFSGVDDVVDDVDSMLEGTS